MFELIIKNAPRARKSDDADPEWRVMTSEATRVHSRVGKKPSLVNVDVTEDTVISGWRNTPREAWVEARRNYRNVEGAIL